MDFSIQVTSKKNVPPYTKDFTNSMIDEAYRDKKVVSAIVATPVGTGLDAFERVFSDRAFNVGFAERHGVKSAAGLSAADMWPFAVNCCTFLRRACDQVVHAVVIQSLPVRFATDHTGQVGVEGHSYSRAFDSAYLGRLPGMVLMAAADEAELVHMVASTVAIDDWPLGLRYPRGVEFVETLPYPGNRNGNPIRPNLLPDKGRSGKGPNQVRWFRPIHSLIRASRTSNMWPPF